MFLLWGTKIYHFDYFFQLKEKTKYPMYILCIGSVINIVLNIYMIPKLGIVGAAYATVIAYLIVFMMSIIMSRKLIPNTFNIAILVKTVIILLISVLVINIPFIINLSAVAKMIIFVCLYSILTIRYNFQEF